MDKEEAAKNALANVLEVSAGEKIIVICDEHLSEVGEAFADGALDLGMWVRLVFLESKEIRKDIPSHIREVFTSQRPDVFLNVIRGISEETPFRIKMRQMEVRERRRLGHCPGITTDMLTDGALSLSDEEYKAMQTFAMKLLHFLEGSTEIHLTNPMGTDITLIVRGREFFTDAILNWKSLKWMNLPVGEVCVAPVEYSVNGTLVCDLAVGGVHRLKEPMEITVKGGKAADVRCKEKEVLERVSRALNMDMWSSVVGEFAVGINHKARLVDEFLESEKIYGTSHMAFGNNLDFPDGRNSSMNHMDFLVSKPTVELVSKDGTIHFMKDGKFKI